MMQVQYMKPFYTKITGDKLRLVFAYQYFSILKENEIFHFIPIEGKEMIINMKTQQIENLSEVFVFQKGNRFIRLPLYQLLLITNVHDHLAPILESATPKQQLPLVSTVTVGEIDQLIAEIENKNLDNLIDQALLENNKSLFFILLQQKNHQLGGFKIE
ncbi:transcriptional regulator [Lysinibacillus fusiformis]|uniref:transcriptional regulator n=1 Tax=Lysinibacillus fusiformis TaxID=28031 RepID=UPI00263A4E72|nr:transcriptional regulator [Lysinibacillus fusiformis]MDC6270283.1 transcriptional regulator [Lysinibacillus sphaericus]MDN4971664.1 transcriptional regulator [Lysinibacillus fusiformis]